jgi:hypothetical protein
MNFVHLKAMLQLYIKLYSTNMEDIFSKIGAAICTAVILAWWNSIWEC